MVELYIEKIKIRVQILYKKQKKTNLPKKNNPYGLKHKKILTHYVQKKYIGMNRSFGTLKSEFFFLDMVTPIKAPNTKSVIINLNGSIVRTMERR